MRRIVSHRYQNGAVIVTVSLVMLFLLGFMGIALDFGHLFIVKTELQTAMDSCALAAAQELDGMGGANNSIDRARQAGRTAGNQNRVNIQSVTWGGQGAIIDADITFRDSTYNPTTNPVAARYAECQHTQANIQMWLLHTMAAFSGPSPAYANTQTVMASAVATRASAQSTCPVPIALRPKPGGTSPNYGFAAGEWVTLLGPANAAMVSNIGWANLDGSNNAAETEAEMNGFCGTTVGDTLGTPGVQAGVADAWNSRFGIYRGSAGPATQYRNPDFTGYSYTATNWPAQANAFSDFVLRRAQYASCGGSTTACQTITGLNLNPGGFQRFASAGLNGEHFQYGSNRRIVTVPIINAANNVINFACMLMLQPITIGGGGGSPGGGSPGGGGPGGGGPGGGGPGGGGPGGGGGAINDVQLEFIGNAGATNSPCTTSGLAGGTAGPLVPVLVR
ncbi:MAG TPA: Tad domain-containing protein [Noviherbaspirillum sp.]|jgi:hypothetical protein|uniref:TadE/TadG family type IV pilus assembly protein n=1 Tax=Noviherbaspirillum sp. TaxID=1926288 RepID=UPI002DDD49C6|nr:Tad domain-containing protein [Noviherbaspirillum sp.]HEV2610995.1 Tad domain-containing protein [Noviherbaspirillum sp.]